MPSDGGGYESEYEDEEDVDAAVTVALGEGQRTERETALDPGGQAQFEDIESAEDIAQVADVHHPEEEGGALADDQDAINSAPSGKLKSRSRSNTPRTDSRDVINELLAIESDLRGEGAPQQSARSAPMDAEPGSTASQTPRAPPRRLTADAARCQRLERLLNQSKKANAELRNQLQHLYRNDAIAQLENRAKARQMRIDELTQENRLLKHQQRQLSKEIEDFNDSKSNFPTERRALTEQLRRYKDKLRELKDARQTSDDKLAKLHQHVVDLTIKNKALTEQVRHLEDASSRLTPTTSSSRLPSHVQEVDTVIASQEEEITRLQQRVALMKKAHRAECSKYDKQLKASQDEVEQARQSMETFEQQVAQRDKAARAQYLSLKALKRAVHELALAHQSNQHLEQLLTEREVRYANGRSPRPRGQRHQAHSHQHPSGRQLGEGSGLNQSSPAFHQQSERIYDTLLHLGYVPPLGSPARSKSIASIGRGDAPDAREAIEPEHLESLPDVEFVQGRLIPRPPPSSTGDANTGHVPLGSRGRSARSQLYTTRSSSSGGLFERCGSGNSPKTEVAAQESIKPANAV